MIGVPVGETLTTICSISPETRDQCFAANQRLLLGALQIGAADIRIVLLQASSTVDSGMR